MPIRDFMEQWLSLEENRHTWICTENRRVLGLISARNKTSSSLWEIDRLYLSTGADGEVCTKLLNYLSAVGGEIGMQRVFLRLAAASPLLDFARQAGFFPFQNECLYHWNGHTAPLFATEVLARPKANADDHSIFQLYNSTVPAVVRQAQAMTFQEWRELREKSQEMHDRKEFVVQQNNVTVAWLRILTRRRTGQFEILVRPDAEDLIEGLVSFALSRLNSRSVVHALVPEYNARLCRVIEETGFAVEMKYSSLVKQLAVQVRQPRLVPVRA